MSTMTTLRPPSGQPATLEATPYWAWELHHHRGMEIARTASRLGVSRFEVLHLLGAYKPVAAALEARRMARAPEPRIDQVNARARETYVRLGELLGIPDPRTCSWDSVGARLADRIGAAHFIKGAVLWMWNPEARTEADQRESAVGIQIVPGGLGHYSLLDWQARERSQVTSLKSAEIIASRIVKRSPAMMDCAA